MKDELVASCLSNLGFEALNNIQEEAIRASRKNTNLCLYAQTGSGKTLAFLLPILAGLQNQAGKIQALILVPSRELAQQIEQVWKKMHTGHKVLSCYGGHPFSEERQSLTVPPALLIATPGRLCDHILRETISLNLVKTVVIDEFDKCLELGFEQEMKSIFAQLPTEKKLILTSATLLDKIPAFLSPNDFNYLEFLDGQTPASITFHEIAVSRNDDKLHHLLLLLSHLGAVRCIIFCNHREAVERISTHLKDNRIENVFYHGGLEQEDRERALIKFRNGSSNILVSTDLGSRGLDIPEIKAVVHYQFPHDEQAFVHRSGRTARMQKEGDAYLVIQDGERKPDYLPSRIKKLSLKDGPIKVESPNWQTLFINSGKKDKLRKMDIVGMLTQKGKLAAKEIGVIELYDHTAFVSLPKNKMPELLKRIQEEKIKGKKVKFAIAK